LRGQERRLLQQLCMHSCSTPQRDAGRHRQQLQEY
jgi:hypothetical protein